MGDHDGSLSFTPRLPERLTRLSFGLCFRDRRLKVDVDHDKARYSLSQGPALEIVHHGQTLRVTTDEVATRPIPAAPRREVPTQPPGLAPSSR